MEKPPSVSNAEGKFFLSFWEEKMSMERSRWYEWLDIKSEWMDSALSIGHRGLTIAMRYFYPRLTQPEAEEQRACLLERCLLSQWIGKELPRPEMKDRG